MSELLANVTDSRLSTTEKRFEWSGDARYSAVALRLAASGFFPTPFGDHGMSFTLDGTGTYGAVPSVSKTNTLIIESSIYNASGVKGISVAHGYSTLSNLIDAQNVFSIDVISRKFSTFESVSNACYGPAHDDQHAFANSFFFTLKECFAALQLQLSDEKLKILAH